MKVLVFSHGSDIDGMGSIIISKVFFKAVDYYFCEMSDIDQKIMDTFQSKEIYQYDWIFVTDLCPNNHTLQIIKDDSELVSKFIVIDHHITRLNQVGDYDFVHITIKDKKGMCSATSLFYEYLIMNKMIQEKESVSAYSEFTRLEDTWEWKKNNTIVAHHLSHLFNVLGRDEYVHRMSQKLKKNHSFSLTDEEKVLIEGKLRDIGEVMKSYTSSIKDIEINHLKGALVIIDYQYRNEFPEYLESHHYDYDFAMMACFNHNSISFRSVSDCNVREIAELYGGGGHDKAASCSLEGKKEEIYRILLEKDNGSIYHFDLNDRAFQAIKAGKKRIEIRATKIGKNHFDYSVLKKNDFIIFKNSKMEEIKCKILDINWYQTIEELLTLEGTKYTLSSTDDYEKGIQSIYQLDGYRDSIPKNGVFAIHIQYLGT